MDVNGVLVGAQVEPIPLEALQAETLRDRLELRSILEQVLLRRLQGG